MLDFMKYSSLSYVLALYHADSTVERAFSGLVLPVTAPFCTFYSIANGNLLNYYHDHFITSLGPIYNWPSEGRKC